MIQKLGSQNKLWFASLDTPTLCRGGGNGPKHPSQMYAINKYVTTDMTFLDIGCGSGTTFEAMGALPKKYKGVDFIQANIDFCRSKFPDCEWEVENAENLKEANKSWDVVFSRHLLEHLSTFEVGLIEHLRVAKQYVIIILWAQLLDAVDDRIMNIMEHDQIYKTEYSNRYSRSKIHSLLGQLKEWKVVEFTEGVGNTIGSLDTVIVLKHI